VWIAVVIVKAIMSLCMYKPSTKGSYKAIPYMYSSTHYNDQLKVCAAVVDLFA